MLFEDEPESVLQRSNNKAELLLMLERCDSAYREGAPIVSDDVYDCGFRRAKEKWPNAPFFTKSNGATPKQKVALGHYLGSLDKIYPEGNALELKINKMVEQYGDSFGLFPKLDGIAGLVKWVDGELSLVATQGDDGKNGENLMHHADALNIKRSIRGCADVPQTLAVRGEFIIKRDYSVILADLEPGYKGDLRSAAGGLLRRQRHSDALKVISFIGYELLDAGSDWHYYDQLNICNQVSYELPWFADSRMNEEVSAKDLRQYLTELYSTKDQWAYDCDGIVVRALGREHSYELASGNPDYSFAYKETSAGVQTTVRDVKFSVGKTGLVSGTLVFDPIKVGGITATEATIKSAHFLMTGYNDPPTPIGPGAVVIVERSGAVIPNTQSVVSGVAEWAKPPFRHELRGKNWYALDATLAQRSNELLSWLSKTECELGESFALAAASCEYSIKDLLLGDVDYNALRDAGATSTVPLLTQRLAKFREDILKTSLVTLIAAHGPFAGIGENRALVLLQRWPFLLDLPTLPDLTEHTGGCDAFVAECERLSIGSISNTFLAAWDDFADALYECGYDAHAVTKMPNTGKQVCFSGFRDDALARRWEALGNVYADKLVKSTWGVVCSPDMMEGTKAQKMRKYGGSVLSIEEFTELLK